MNSFRSLYPGTWFAVFAMCLSACASAPRAYESLRASDLLAPAEPVQERDWDDVLSRKEVREDVDLVIYALENGYAGKSILPSESYEDALERLGKIKGPLTVSVLMDKLDAVLMSLPDSYLWAYRESRIAELRGQTFLAGQVGKNRSADGGAPWGAERVSWGGRQALLVSLPKLPSAADPAWRGFLENIDRLRANTDAIVFDLRGNGGGDATMGLRAIESLAEDEYRHPIKSRRDRVTPEAKALVRNALALKIAKLRQKGEPVPEELAAKLAEKELEYRTALASSAQGTAEGPLPFERRKKSRSIPFHRPIYVLFDRACVSTCEFLIDAFEFFPRAVKVGERSGGYVHFSNLGALRLPHSGITIGVPTSTLVYYDGRFIEKKGIAPEVEVEAGRDALAVVRERILKRKD